MNGAVYPIDLQTQLLGHFRYVNLVPSILLLCCCNLKKKKSSLKITNLLSRSLIQPYGFFHYPMKVC